MKTILVLFITLSSFAYGASAKVIVGYSEGSSSSDTSIEEAESYMYKNAFKYCGDLTPIRIDDIYHVDVGYRSHAFATFVCKNISNLRSNHT